MHIHIYDIPTTKNWLNIYIPTLNVILAYSIFSYLTRLILLKIQLCFFYDLIDIVHVL